MIGNLNSIAYLEMMMEGILEEQFRGWNQLKAVAGNRNKLDFLPNISHYSERNGGF